jgi:signal transduction histidine kinase
VLLTTAFSVLLGLGLAHVSIRRLDAQYTSETAAKLAAKRATETRDELLAVVSHDLRTPLTAIRLGTALLSEAEPDERQRKHVDRISKAASRMEHLIEQLLDAEKIDQGKLELKPAPLRVTDLVGIVAALVEAQLAAQRLKLEIDVDPGLTIVADEERLLQVLSNLLSNAAKFTPPGGTITVAARSDQDCARIEVTDTGPGIAADQIGRLFDRYWQGGSAQRSAGLGLGLYISRQIVEAHGGRIGVTSRPFAGSTFWFSLPRPRRSVDAV